MIAIDTSSLARFLAGIEGRDTLMVDAAVRGKAAVLPPVVLVELLSNPAMQAPVQKVIEAIPLVSVADGYWERAGKLRATLVKRRLKAALADCLIAQSCIDGGIPLITFDRDYRHFVNAGLKVL